MEQAETVQVFNFRAFDFRAAEMQLSKYKATRETIARFHGEVLEGTSEEVSVDDLDDRGRFRRVATWCK